MSALISTDELEKLRLSQNVKIIDASWYMPSEKRDAYEEYLAMHIPEAVFFDIDAASDPKSPYPHMLPSKEAFSVYASSLGASNTSEIVVYDSSGLFSAPRVWWMFRIFGHADVKVLDGGLPKWQAEHRPVQSGTSDVEVAHFQTHFDATLLRDKIAVRSNIDNPRELLLDARSPGRFSGQEPEPRSGLKSGHIENSMNVFFKDCLTPPFNQLKSREALSLLFNDNKVDFYAPISVSCGSGVTACILALALYELGNKNVAVYDGAWAEWGSLAP